MRRSAVQSSVALATLAFLSSAVIAVQPQFWRLDSMRDFQEGEAKGLSIDSAGNVFLAPVVRSGAGVTAPYVWSLATDKSGTVYVGTGSEGKIFKVEGRMTQTFWDAPELEVQALATGSDGRVYAATNPEGKVYAIDKNGKSEVFFDPSERYIWAIVFDGSGRLLVATGGEGKVYRVDSKGQGTAVLTSPDAHITAIAIGGSKGQWYAGSSPSGLVYEIDSRDHVQVLHDSNFREVKALVAGASGAVYAAMVDGRPEIGPRPGPSPSPSASPAAGDAGAVAVPGGVSIDVFAFPNQSNQGRNENARSGTGPARGAIVKISALGEADQIWSGDESPFFMVRRGTALTFGTGSRGRVYEVRDDRSYTLVRTLSAEQLTAGVMSGAELVIGASNPGALQFLEAKSETTGTLTSAVRDFDNASRLGAFDVAGPTGSTYEIRSGNSATPDGTWSNWEALVIGKAPSSTPPARFAQLRATLGSAATAPPKSLSWMSLAYVQRNQRPLIREITVHPAGDAFQRSGGGGDTDIAGLDSGNPEIKAPPAVTGRSTESANTGRKVTQRGIRTVMWRAEDVNGDDLVYDVLYRLESETAFRKLRENLDDPIVAWDTTTVPSGRYVFRIVASDRKANADGLALSYERETEAFDVDNVPPTISATTSNGVVRVTVSDTMNVIRKIEWAPEAGVWSDAPPVDGVNDSREEIAEIKIPAPAPAAIVIRALDAFGNIALQRVPLGR